MKHEIIITGTGHSFAASVIPAYADTSFITYKPVPLRKFIEHERYRRGFTQASLETFAGITHPRYHSFARGKDNSIKTALEALDALGYKIIIEKR